jgi:hypothetical protein
MTPYPLQRLAFTIAPTHGSNYHDTNGTNLFMKLVAGLVAKQPTVAPACS